MFVNICAIAMLFGQTNDADQVENATPEIEKVTRLTFDNMTFSGHRIRFESTGDSRVCTIEGNASLMFGDIRISADRIRLDRESKPEAIVCVGNCRWQQDDDTGEIFTGDKLELSRNGLQLSGNASLQYGSGTQQTFIECDSISVELGSGCYQLTGAVRLKYGEDCSD